MPHPSLALFLFAASNSQQGSGGSLILVIFFGVGILLFILGFRTYREYRILEDTPLAPIRSIPMGLVHIHGKAMGEDRLSSPLTRTPCYYYNVQVEKWVRKDKDHEGWETFHTESEMRPFVLDDTTGKVQVDPAHAEFDVPKTFQGGIGPRAGGKRFLEPTLGVPGPTPQDLQGYLSQSSGKIGQALSSLPVPGASVLGKVLEAEQQFEARGITFTDGGITLGTGGPSFRFTEHCLIAGREGNIIGTCVENPSPKDEHDRNLIKKGQNEPTFLISLKGEKELEKSLRRKAFLLILVGAVVMVGTAAFLLAKLGLFK